MRLRNSKLLRALIGTFVVGLVAFAVLINAVRLTFPLLNHKKQRIEAWASQVIGQPVSIQSMQATWYGFEPQIEFSDVRVQTSSQPGHELLIKHLAIGINLWDSLRHWRLLPSRLVIYGAHFDIFQGESGQVQVYDKTNASQRRDFLLWLLTQADVRLRNIDITFHGKNGMLLPIHNLTIDVRNGPFVHHIVGQVNLQQMIDTRLKFILDLRNVKDGFAKMQANLYLQAQDVVLQQWLQNQNLSQLLPGLKITRGIGNFAVWADWSQSQLHSMQAKIKISQAGIDLSTLYDHPLNVDQLAATVALTHTATQTDIKLVHFGIDDGNLTANTRAELILPKQGKKHLSLLGGFRLLSVNRLDYYLPQRHFSKALRDWMVTALHQGNLQHGTVMFDGALDDFPFDKHQGRFQAQVQFNHMHINFDPQWPALENCQGTLNFTDRRMTVDLDRVVTLGNSIQNVKATIDKVNYPVLNVTGQADTQLNKAISYLTHTPLAIGQSFKTLQTEGPVSANLSLTIPLGDVPLPKQASGSIQFDHNRLVLPTWRLALNDIQGVLNFKDTRLWSSGLAVKFHGDPAQIKVSTQQSASGSSYVELGLQGITHPKALIPYFNPSWMKQLSGDIPYSGYLRLHGAGRKQRDGFYLKADLSQLDTSRMPSWFSHYLKSAQQLTVAMALQARRPILLRVQYGKQISAALTLIKRKTIRLVKGEIHLGKGRARYQNLPGLLVTGYLPYLDWQTIAPLLFRQGTHQHQLKVRLVQVLIGDLHIFGQTIKRLYLTVRPVAEGTYINMSSDAVAGQVYIPKQASLAWQINLDQLILTTKKKLSGVSFNPNRLPPIQLTIKKLVHNGNYLGYFSMRASPMQSGLRIDELKQASSTMQLQASGEWTAQDTHLVGNLKAQNFGQLLENFADTKKLASGKGALWFDIHWPGALTQFHLKNISGSVHLQIANGVITALGRSAQSELGLGRVLTILSLQALPRRLTTGFKDLRQKGFNFDKMSGDMAFKKGEMTTHNGYIAGPVARIQMQGSVDFANETTDMYVLVEPQVTSSVPVIAGLAGGPIAIGVAWVVNKFAEPMIGRAIGSWYKVTGSLKDPTVVKYHVQQRQRHLAPVETR